MLLQYTHADPVAKQATSSAALLAQASHLHLQHVIPDLREEAESLQELIADLTTSRAGILKAGFRGGRA